MKVDERVVLHLMVTERIGIGRKDEIEDGVTRIDGWSFWVFFRVLLLFLLFSALFLSFFVVFSGFVGFHLFWFSRLMG